jgi:hypothetical protein
MLANPSDVFHAGKDPICVDSMIFFLDKYTSKPGVRHHYSEVGSERSLVINYTAKSETIKWSDLPLKKWAKGRDDKALLPMHLVACLKNPEISFIRYEQDSHCTFYIADYALYKVYPSLMRCFRSYTAQYRNEEDFTLASVDALGAFKKREYTVYAKQTSIDMPPLELLIHCDAFVDKLDHSVLKDVEYFKVEANELTWLSLPRHEWDALKCFAKAFEYYIE